MPGGKEGPIPPHVQHSGPCIEVCATCEGRGALLADLEDLCGLAPGVGKPRLVKCLNACFEGPNCIVRPLAATADGKDLEPQGPPIRVHKLVGFEQTVELVRQAASLSELVVPGDVARRARLRSDAMRLLQMGSAEALQRAVELLDEALDIENTIGSETRTRELRMLRAEALGSRVLRRYSEAVADLDMVLSGNPRALDAVLAMAKVHRRAHRWQEALASFQAAEDVVVNPSGALPEGALLNLPWIRRSIAELGERMIEEDAMNGGEFGATAGEDCEDSGDGGGWWKVVKVIGVSTNTCLYYLENHPPAVPHPYPLDLWNVSVRFGPITRDYTPVSTVQDWECGRITLLVKTYADGAASGRFARLMPANTVASLQVQQCWLLVSIPRLTQSLQSAELRPKSRAPVKHLVLVVGGTGVAPALQALRHVAGAQQFEATALVSARTAADVLLLDELRQVQSEAPDRIRVRHTLTDQKDNTLQFYSESTPERAKHNFYSLNPWRPWQPASGPLDLSAGGEAGLRGRASAKMLSQVLPAPGEDVHVIVSGPPSMWEDMRATLLDMGHREESLTELKALTPEQC